MDFSKLTAYMDTLSSVGVPGCDMVIYRDHEQLYRHSAGYRDPENTRPIQGDETYCLYSCTKVFTSCAAMQLIERGIINLDDPVSAYLPAYAHLTVRNGDTVRPAKRVMTVRHLLSMQSGLDYVLDSPAMREALESTHGQATTRQLAEAKAKDPLCFEPGTNFLYSLSHDVLAAVIEVASGMRFSDYLKANIFDPLDLKTVGFEMSEDRLNRLCAQYVMNAETGKRELCPPEVMNYRLTPNYESGGAGLICDVRDYSLFVDALACDGTAKDGTRILTPETIQLWSANQLCPEGRKTFDIWKRLGYSYGLGVRTRVDLSVGGRGQIGEFGWDGAACSWAMIDPVNHLSAFYAMHVRNFGFAYDVIHPRLRDLLYGVLDA